MRSGSMVGIPETLSPQLAELFDPTAPKSVTSRLPEPLVFGRWRGSERYRDLSTDVKVCPTRTTSTFTENQLSA